MIKLLKIQNFTEFSQASFDFSEGLNVIIGDNSTGKSHLLKLAYTIMYVWHEAKRQQEEIPGEITFGGSESWWQRRFAEKLVKVFKPDTLGRLCRVEQNEAAQIEAQIFKPTETQVAIKFSHTSKTEVELLQKPIDFPSTIPLFLPAPEVLSLFPSFIRIYEERMLAFEEIYYDLCKALSIPLLKNQAISLLEPLEKIIGGEVKLKSDRFYIHFPEQGDREIYLIAEGVRKVAMLSYLIANDSLKKGSTLFWDEPETHLNPRMMRQVAQSLIQLVENGIQIILTTHHLFLMKELAFQATHSPNKISTKFFSLVQPDITIEEGETLTDLSTIVTLDEEIALFSREQEAFYAALEGK
jgi:AAA15 family ATPase/GTPase